MSTWQHAHDLAQAALGMAPKGSREGYWGLAAAALAVLDLHRPLPVHLSVGECKEPDMHVQLYDSATDWWFCGQCPPAGYVCEHCSDLTGDSDFDAVGMPCETLRALGVTE